MALRNAAAEVSENIARRLQSIQSKRIKNLDKKPHCIWLTRAELASVPDDTLSGLDTVYDTVFKNDPLDDNAGRRYKHTVLEKGGSQGQLETLVQFLGRRPTSEAFYRSLGLDWVHKIFAFLLRPEFSR